LIKRLFRWLSKSRSPW